MNEMDHLPRLIRGDLDEPGGNLVVWSGAGLDPTFHAHHPLRAHGGEDVGGSLWGVYVGDDLNESRWVEPSVCFYFFTRQPLN